MPGLPSTSHGVVVPRILVLGSLELAGPDGSPTTQPVGSVRIRRALALLTLSNGSVVSTDRLAAVVWPQSLPANPDAALHTVISRLRSRSAKPTGC